MTQANDQDRQDSAAEATNELAVLAQRGGVLAALLVLVVALFYAFAAITDIIRIWLEPQWVPVWNALFALGVVALALWVVLRLTGAKR